MGKAYRELLLLNDAAFILRKIVSGGQTGVDRAALDAAITAGFDHGGWCPLGRIAEDGFIPVRYRLRQTDSPRYAVRTEQNVLDSDGTLLVFRGEPSGGTELTLRFCQQFARPCFLLELGRESVYHDVHLWMREKQIAILNVAGPRESTCPGIYEEAGSHFQTLFCSWKSLIAGESVDP